MSTRKGVPPAGRLPARQSVRNRPPGPPPIGVGGRSSWEYGGGRPVGQYPGPGGYVMDIDMLEEPGKHTKFKHCCRSFATFMCTQVGVGGIIVVYAILGAIGFIYLETEEGNICDITLGLVNESRARTAEQLYKDFSAHRFMERDFHLASNSTLFDFQQLIVRSVKENGYDGRNVHEQWNFPASLMFTLSIFTMIGYGNLVPRTQWGKVITICYAIFGIPIYILYFMNMGKTLAKTFKWLYVKLNSLGKGKGSSNEEISNSADFRSKKRAADHDLVPSSASLYVLMTYIGVGTIMFVLNLLSIYCNIWLYLDECFINGFAEWENWEYLDSIYFTVTSLCKIGLGDFVPGTSLDDSQEGSQTKLIINFIYLLLGLGLVSMNYNLLKEEVVGKMKQIKSDLKDACLFFRNECNCCK